MNIFDLETIAVVTAGDDQMLADLAIAFARQFPDTRARFRVAVEHADSVQIVAAAHRLRTHLAYFGADELIDLSTRVQDAAQGQDFRQVTDVADAMFDGIDRMLDQLRQLTRLTLDVSDD